MLLFNQRPIGQAKYLTKSKNSSKTIAMNGEFILFAIDVQKICL